MYLNEEYSKYRRVKLDVIRKEVDWESLFGRKDVQVFNKIYNKRINIGKLEVGIAVVGLVFY